MSHNDVSDEMAKMGRPPKAPKDRRTEGFKVLLSRAERQRTKAAAKAVGKDESAWAREVLLEAAERLEHGDASDRKQGLEYGLSGNPPRSRSSRSRSTGETGQRPSTST